MTQWRFAVEYVVRSQNMESRLNAVEGVYYVGHGTIVPRDDGRGLPKRDIVKSCVSRLGASLVEMID
jgi:hypothetical protein